MAVLGALMMGIVFLTFFAIAIGVCVFIVLTLLSGTLFASIAGLLGFNHLREKIYTQEDDFQELPVYVHKKKERKRITQKRWHCHNFCTIKVTRQQKKGINVDRELDIAMKMVETFDKSHIGKYL